MGFVIRIVHISSARNGVIVEAEVKGNKLTIHGFKLRHATIPNFRMGSGCSTTSPAISALLYSLLQIRWNAASLCRLVIMPNIYP